MLSCGRTDLAVAQTRDLGNRRPRVPNNATDHFRQDRDVLRADLPDIGHGRSTYRVVAGVVAEGGATVTVGGEAEMMGTFGGIGVREGRCSDQLKAVDAFVERL